MWVSMCMCVSICMVHKFPLVEAVEQHHTPAGCVYVCVDVCVYMCVCMCQFACVCVFAFMSAHTVLMY